MKVIRISEVTETPNTSPGMTPGVTGQPIVTDAMANNFRCNHANFSRGATSKFHSHTSDQLLIITSGIGIVATETEEHEVTVGDVIHTPAGEKHLHGARKDTSMSHPSVNAKGSGMTLSEE